MSGIPISPMNQWLQKRTGLFGLALTRQNLLQFQLGLLRSQIAYAREYSRFYRKTLHSIDIDALCDLDALEALPLCQAVDIVSDPNAFVCVPQYKIERITTIFSSGSTGFSKRLFFSERDLESTVEFFHHGMSCLADQSDTVLILMPCGIPGSIGDLLKRGLEQLGARYVEHGPVSDYAAALEAARKNRVTSMVGIPSQVYRMAKLDPALRPRSILLSADYVPESVISLIKRNWQTEVFVHYGLTESGLGGGVECNAHNGFHMRDMDMLFEIVDPSTGKHIADGETGEIVFSTLNREAMPLIRYRTGDMAAFLPGPCPCGMDLPRLGRVQGRFANRINLHNGESLSIEELDEALFDLEPVLDYTAELRTGDTGQAGSAEQGGSVGQGSGQTLRLALLTDGVYDKQEIERKIRERVHISCPIEITEGEGFFTRGTRKREIQLRIYKNPVKQGDKHG